MKGTFISLMSVVLLSCLCFGTAVSADSESQADGVQQTNTMIPDERQKPGSFFSSPRETVSMR